jgi:hypothetical protein
MVAFASSHVKERMMMRFNPSKDRPQFRWNWRLAVLIATSFAPLVACGHKADTAAQDERFAPQTEDEYTAPISNVVIGTPAGVVRGATRMPDGRVVGGEIQREAEIHSTAPVVPPDAGGGGGSGSSSSGGGPGSDGGGFGEGGVIDDGGGDGGVTGGFGQWHFDDCSPTSHFLVDSSGFGANAQHALGAACVPGISNLAVEFRTAKDVVQVPDEPQFTLQSLVAAAAWVHPNTVSGNQPIVVKRLNNQTAFSLGIHNGNIEMSVVLASGTTVISQAPISPGVWTHVAGMYDGTFVFLFINGQQFGQVYGGSALRNVFAPLRIGATSQTQHFDGIIDEVFVSTEAISKNTLTALACIQHGSTLAVSPATSGPVPFNTTVHYDLSIADNDVGFCDPRNYNLFFQGTDPGISASFDPPGPFATAQPGTTANIGVEVTGSDLADPGIHQVPFVVQDFEQQPTFSFETLFGQLTYELAVPTGCFVFTKRELMITSTSVVDDPVRTFGNTTPGSGGGGGFDAGVPPPPLDGGAPPPPPPPPAPTDAGTNPTEGAWSFAHLMRESAPSPDQAPAMVLQLLQHWLTNQTVNGFTVAARPLMQQDLIDIWPKTPTGDLDLDQAPVTLEAIVNRVDIRNLSQGAAGEGRFIFGVNGPAFQNFTIIVEYTLPAQTQADVLGWANRWHALSSNPFPSEQYNAALEALTRSFTDRNSLPSGVNGSALAELRTNEIALSGFSRWELRGFVLSPTTGFFDETTVKETPDLSFNNTPTLANLVNQNAAAIEAVVPGANGNTIPLQFGGQNFLGGSVFNDLIEWNAPGIADPNARFHMSLNTCNGCHGPETNTSFLMITPRFAGSEATLSPFLTGTTVFDQFSGQVRTLNDLQRRNADLTSLVCGAPDGGGGPADAGPPPPPPPFDGGAD